MARFKHSQFNRIVAVPKDGTWALVNFRTGAFVALDAALKAAYDAAPTVELPASVVRPLTEGGFLVDAALDEPHDLYRELRAKAAAGGLLSLTIMTTLACNCACPYCFEHKRAGAMDDATADAVASFVEARLRGGAYTRLNIEWFGGEPLLNVTAIERISARVVPLCRELGVAYRATMPTNGTLLTQELADRLAACDVSQIQITVDGSRATHDALRPLRGGGSSYDLIVRNLYAVRTGIKISIRCNVHAGNAGDRAAVAALARELAAETGNDVSFAAVPLKDNAAMRDRGFAFTPLDAGATEDAGADADNNALARADIDGADTRAGHAHTGKEAGASGVGGGTNGGVDASRHPGAGAGGSLDAAFRPIATPCDSGNPSYYTIDELGNLSHCKETAAAGTHVFANVLTYDEADERTYDAERASFFARRTYPENPKCLACDLLPTCLGGCMLYRPERPEDVRCPPKVADAGAYVLERYRSAGGAPRGRCAGRRMVARLLNRLLATPAAD